jgi:hypothetical protein
MSLAVRNALLVAAAVLIVAAVARLGGERSEPPDAREVEHADGDSARRQASRPEIPTTPSSPHELPTTAHSLHVDPERSRTTAPSFDIDHALEAIAGASGREREALVRRFVDDVVSLDFEARDAALARLSGVIVPEGGVTVESLLEAVDNAESSQARERAMMRVVTEQGALSDEDRARLSRELATRFGMLAE